jgi:hypothetical protein
MNLTKRCFHNVQALGFLKSNSSGGLNAISTVNYLLTPCNDVWMKLFYNSSGFERINKQEVLRHLYYPTCNNQQYENDLRQMKHMLIHNITRMTWLVCDCVYEKYCNTFGEQCQID